MKKETLNIIKEVAVLMLTGVIGTIGTLTIAAQVVDIFFDDDEPALEVVCEDTEVAPTPQIIKEIVREVPVEVIKEVPVEVEVIKHEPNCYDLIEISPEEYDLMAQIVALECKTQPDVGQRAVVEVILNRVLDNWGSSVWDVLTQKGQFSTLKYLDNPYATPEDKEYNNIDYVLEHGRTVLPEHYVYFATYKANGTDFIQIQEHYFGKEK